MGIIFKKGELNENEYTYLMGDQDNYGAIWSNLISYALRENCFDNEILNEWGRHYLLGFFRGRFYPSMEASFVGDAQYQCVLSKCEYLAYYISKHEQELRDIYEEPLDDDDEEGTD